MISTERATLGGGCFWYLEAVYGLVAGVKSVTPGYAGGHVENPTLERVRGGLTGHAEVVQIEFDPATISFEALLEIFFAIHDPTTLNRQGADVGPEYRSAVFTHDDRQARAAQDVCARLEADGVWRDPIVTRLEPLDTFHPAAADHRAYFERNAEQPYCQAVVAPKVATFRQRFAHRLVASR